MRHLLRLLSTRYGAALAMLVVIAAVVGIGKLAGGHAGSGPDPAAADAPSAISTESQPPDDGMVSVPPAAAPSTSPGAADPVAVATEFIHAWLNHVGISQDAWHTALSRYATGRLANELAQTDPADVPASRMTGTPSLVPRAESYVDVLIPLDAGKVDLRLVSDRGRWLVDGVDWQRP